VLTEEDVIQACIDRDFVTLRRWGQQDVRVCGLASGIALEAAIINNDVDLVRCLVKDLGFDIRSQFLNRLPPAFVAAKEGHSDMLLCLANELGADIVRESNGYTPFHIASHFGHLDVLRCLVNDLGAVSNSAARFFRKPLLSATKMGHLHVVRYFIQELGADANHITPSPENTLLMVAAENGHIDVVRYYVEELLRRSSSAPRGRCGPHTHG
jgi:ankyrin repeat protein